MYTQEEKILILGSLFHDVGKFVQRCTGNLERKTHQNLGGKFAEDLKSEFINVLENNEDAFIRMKKIILEHHNKNLTDDLVKIVQTADHISAGERVEKESNEEMGEEWSHKYLSSLFSKINLLSNEKTDVRYYKQVELTKGNYDAMIPLEKARAEINKYNNNTYCDFFDNVKTVLKFYDSVNDFDTILNLLLVVLEKYLWCIPDFTGSSETDISLYNHLKDVCGLSLAIYKSDKEKTDLNLIIGDLPGIQNYIFNVVNKKPAKILRGRSINVQILTRNFATKLLNDFGLSDANLVMLAGGKFYIIAQQSDGFTEMFNKSKVNIEKYLSDEYKYELQFNSSFETFDYNKLKNKQISFGQIIENATGKLNSNKHKLFSSKFNFGNEKEFVLDSNYIEAISESDSIKCRVTDRPIKKGREGIIKDLVEKDEYIVDKLVEIEYSIGHKVIESNLVVEMNENNLEVKLYEEFMDYYGKGNENAYKILINPDLDKLLKEKDHINFLKKIKFIEVANYTSGKNNVMSFEEMSKDQEGAKNLSLIKGDIDNLGIMMAYGLSDDNNDVTSISRTTTLSNHLKYYFSFFMNGFLKSIDETGLKREGKENLKSSSYVIFAGGDDLMIVCPQTKSLEVLSEFNAKFNEFVCNNNEVHISYSITNFNHSTPIRIVSEISEENQREAKKSEKNKCANLKEDSFLSENNKASTHLFNSIIKNESLNEVLDLEEQYYGWHESKPQKISMGIIRNTLTLTEIIKEWREKQDSSKLIWHPYLSYMINRLLKKDGNYKSQEIGKLYEEILSINKSEEGKNLTEKILYPALCGAIYKLRK